MNCKFSNPNEPTNHEPYPYTLTLNDSALNTVAKKINWKLALYFVT